ncbi:MFS transporter [Frankia sp. Ag45/Mut15]|uniref:MFS transporter n=1 Tax=Frankia umida TaxID=573489 RepID=A0ABT0K4E8_9ACTN|nr:MFS transporter [Frankia umida]MCK9878379.1 MFS transporter [Frankia umida]
MGETRAAVAVARPHVPLAAVVALACTAQFMVVLDTTIVNVALPDMRRALGLSVAGQQWVVTAYLVTFGGLLLLAARAGDLLGRRLVFQVGLVVFGLASLAGGLAGNGATLLAARAVQGIGAAALAPASLSLITASHHEPAARTRALSFWSAAASGAGAVGMILGGVLTDGLSWRWVLFVNVPIGVGLLLATIRVLAPSERGHGRSLDVPGAVVITAAVATLVFAVSRATQSGWGSAQVIAGLAAAVVLLGVFAVLQVRVVQPLDGQPQTSIVWPHADDQHILVGTQTGRQKYRDILADPRATILLHDSANPRRYIEVRGRIVATETGPSAIDLAHLTFTRWTGGPTLRQAEGERVLLRLRADHIHRKGSR